MRKKQMVQEKEVNVTGISSPFSLILKNHGLHKKEKTIENENENEILKNSIMSCFFYSELFKENQKIEYLNCLMSQNY